MLLITYKKKGEHMYDMAPVETMNIKKLILIEAAGYNQQWVRSFTINAGYSEQDTVRDIVAHGMGVGLNSIGSTIMSKLPNMITTAPVVSGRAPIINGWSTSRFKFILEIEYTVPGAGTVDIDYVQGYTDHLGIAPNGALDENMVFTINGIRSFQRVYNRDTGVPIVRPMGSILLTGEDNNVDPDFRLGRPDDVMVHLTTLQSPSPNVNFHGTIGTLSDLNVVDRKHTAPAVHLTDTLTAAITSKQISTAYDDSSSIFQNMTGDLMPPSAEEVKFLRYLISIRGGITKYFTTRDLLQLDPNVEHVVRTILHDEVAMGSYGSTNANVPSSLFTDTPDETHGADVESRVASAVHSSIVSLLDDSFMNRMIFSVTNLTGQPTYAILDMDTYIAGIDLPTYADKFMALFMNRVWPSISNKNQIPLDIVVSALVESETTVTVSTDGRNEAIFRYPTFADNSFMPMIFRNNEFDVLTESYGDVVDVAIDATGDIINQASKIHTGGNRWD